MQKILIKLANLLENASENIKGKIFRKKLYQFLTKNNLKDGKTVISDSKYNPYQVTNLFLIDKMIEAEILSKDKLIMDVGCGAGIFLLYLASKGYKHLYGVEYDDVLYNLCCENIRQYNKKNQFPVVNIFKEDATEFKDIDEIDCFYLANPFFDKETYSKWLSQVKSSLQRKKRKISILVFFPTVSSRGAFKECEWLVQIKTLMDKNQVCWRCMRVIEYSNREI